MNTHRSEQKSNKDSEWKQGSLIQLGDSYTYGLYHFGFLKIVRGSCLEKIFWAIGMSLIILFTSHMVYTNANRYSAFGVSTKIRSEETQKRALPVITFCLRSAFSDSINCYINASIHSKSCNKVSETNKMWYENGFISYEWMKGKALRNGCHVCVTKKAR